MIEGDSEELCTKVSSSDNPRQNIWDKVRKSGEITQDQKYLLFRKFWPLMRKIDFWEDTGH